MRRLLPAVFGLICVLAAVLVYLKVTAPTKLPDEEQIMSLLAAGEEAIEQKDLRGALARVSRDYSDPAGFTYDTLRIQAIEAFRSPDGYDLVVEDTEIRVSGRTAQATCKVSAAVVSGDSRSEVFDSPIGLTLKKEKSRRCLVIPVRSWKVTSITGGPSSAEFLLDSH